MERRRKEEEEEEKVEEEVEVEQRSRSSSLSSFFLSFFSFFFLPRLLLSLWRAPSLLHSQLRPSLPMVGLPWPLGGQRKQAMAIPPPSIFSPSTASPAVSAAHAAPGHLPIRVDPQTAQQVWQGWGTSLCWWANVVGKRMKN